MLLDIVVCAGLRTANQVLEDESQIAANGDQQIHHGMETQGEDGAPLKPNQLRSGMGESLERYRKLF